MLTLSEMISRSRKPVKKVDDQELRGLPYKNAFIYGRVSSPEQVRDSKESIREIAQLVKLAINDGYDTKLLPDQVEEWLIGISNGTTAKGVLADGQVTVDVRDLSISGQLSADSRAGMAALQEGIVSGKTGAVYVTEGVSRLSRDTDRILSYQLLKQMKTQLVRLRTPDGIWNPVIDRDWEYLDEEFQRAAGELKTYNRRMFRRKAQKAARGEFVGEPIPLGFIVPVVAHRPNGQYEYGKYQPYEPHAEIVRWLLEIYVRNQGSLIKTMYVVKDTAISFFPPELSYMERLSALRRCRKLANGYEISPTLVANLAKNLKLIGIWQWGDKDPITINHPAIVPQDLFAEAFGLANHKDKPKGRAVSFEPLEWERLLYCHNETPVRRVVSRRATGIYSCDRDYKYGKGSACFYIRAPILDRPLSRAVLSQLELSPCVEEIIESLENDARQSRFNHIRDRQQVIRLEKEISTLKALLPCCVDETTGAVDREKEKYYWDKIREAERQLAEVKNQPVSLSPAIPDYMQVRSFLKSLPDKWPNYSRTLRNRFLKTLIDRVELKGYSEIEAVIYWKAGFRQEVTIHRKTNRRLVDGLWTEQEMRLLKQLFPDAAKEVLTTSLPGRTWKSITLKAIDLNIKRQRNMKLTEPKPENFSSHIDRETDLDVGRSPNTGELEVNTHNLILHQSLSSGRKRGIYRRHFQNDCVSKILPTLRRPNPCLTGRLKTCNTQIWILAFAGMTSKSRT